MRWDLILSPKRNFSAETIKELYPDAWSNAHIFLMMPLVVFLTIYFWADPEPEALDEDESPVESDDEEEAGLLCTDEETDFSAGFADDVEDDDLPTGLSSSCD